MVTGGITESGVQTLTPQKPINFLLVESKVLLYFCFWGGEEGGLPSKGQFFPTDNQWARDFIGRERGQHKEIAQSTWQSSSYWSLVF